MTRSGSWARIRRLCEHVHRLRRNGEKDLSGNGRLGSKERGRCSSYQSELDPVVGNHGGGVRR